MNHILVAEDERDVRSFLKDELTDAGYRVTVVENGADAVLKATEHSIDLFLLDMLMPGLDGIKTIQVLRKLVPETPIIGLTGYMGRGLMAKAAMHDVNCFSKPVDVELLLDEIEHVLD